MTRAALAIGLALFAISASAQVLTGALSGTVVDPSGNVVPNAVVRLTSDLNGEVRSGVTNENGDFSFPALVAGTYTIRIESSGFRPLERKGTVVLAAGRTAIGNVQLEVGSVTESVT